VADERTLCGCERDHVHAVKHGRDGAPCRCDEWPRHQQCECLFCRNWRREAAEELS
jgi:hypothetical protein